MTRIIYRLLGLLLLYSSSGLAQQTVEGIAATVGQEIILKSEIEQFVQNYALQNKLNIRGDIKLIQNLQKQVLEKMIEQKIMLAKADEDTIKVDDRDVDKRVEENIAYLIQQVGSEGKLEESFQSPMRKIRKDLRKETIERMKIEMLRRTKFQQVKISRREIENFYQTFRDSLPVLKETVNISHILKQVKAGESSTQAALAKMQEIKRKLDEGGDFAELAREYSEDPATAKRGGDLGFTKRGDFVKEFEETAFALAVGQISGIVQTQFGFHIIKLNERRGEQIRTSHILLQVRPGVEDAQKVIDLLNTLRQEILAGASFDSLALLYSDDENVEKDKGNLGDWETDKLAIPAFKEIISKLAAGEVSTPFKTDYGYHILRLNWRKEPRQLTLENDWDQIQQIALNHKIELEYVKWMDKLRKEIPVIYHITFN
jgi:peptidyl-prolyl cis-trans isomerase SurA